MNKRAQRALGRSPEKKVKGHSGAIYRGPLKLSTKYWTIWVRDHTVTIPVEFGQIPISGSREDVV